ncbi:MAG: endonuclease III [Oligoflexia bacterium]|nr:endonuclease III [Oligoflexia bacterium]
MAQAKLKSGSDPAERRRMKEILRVLRRTYPEAKCSLDFGSPFQLLVATILSAQCTDARVNQVTPALFRRFGTPEKLARAELAEIEALIQSTGFFRSKARALKESARAIVDEHGGELPRELEILTALRGVGRKTANVVLGVAYGLPGLVVDTHVKRLARRMGFTRTADAGKIERELMEVVPKEEWTELAHLFIAHGREICTARIARCEECPVARLCPKIGAR